MTLAHTEQHPESTKTRRDLRWIATLFISIVGTCLVTAYAALAYVQIAFLNPVAAVPGMPLDEIWAQVARDQGVAEDSFAVICAFLAAGPVLALGVLLCAVVWLRKRPWVVLSLYLTLLVLGAPVYFVASFGPGMNLADTFGISGADYSPWAEPLYFTSLIALTALIIIGLAGWVAYARRVDSAS